MGYLHGYTETEQQRLVVQAHFLEEKIFESLDLSACRNLLEIGCGTGAECELLLRRFPTINVTAVDISTEQLEKAGKHLLKFPELAGRYRLLRADASNLSGFKGQRFDGSFLCWMLEHVSNPVEILSQVRTVLAPGAPIFITEVFNHSLRVDPVIPSLQLYWEKYNHLQTELGGDPDVGLKLGRHLLEAGFHEIEVWPKFFHWDERHPQARTRMMDYWLDLILSAQPQLLERKLLTQSDIDKLVKDWTAARERHSTIFFYHFMQATALA